MPGCFGTPLSPTPHAARSAEYALRPQQLGRQLKTAAGIGAREAVLLKRERYALREVTVKHLDSGTERAMSLDEFLETLN